MSRLTQFRDAFVNTVLATKQGIGSWLSSFTRRKAFAYLLVFLFTLGVLSSYAFSMPVTFIASALMPAGLELTANIVRFIVTRLTSRVLERVNTTVRTASQAPLGVGEEEVMTHRRGVDPDRVINAIASRNHRLALELVDRIDVNRTQSLLNIASEAIRHDATAVFERVVRIPALQRHLADNNNRLLTQAAREQRVNMVTELLRNQQVKNNAGASNNEALREACSIGSLPIVNALLECPNVTANITFNHNEAVRLAETNGHYDVVARLLTVPAVANYQTPRGANLNFTRRSFIQTTRGFRDPNDIFQNFFERFAVRGVAEPNLRNFANNRENAMASLSENQLRELGEIQRRYQQTFNDRGIDAILAEIRGFLIENYEQNPVVHQGRNLPIEFNRSLPTSVQALYYANKAHTAYRYLFLHPNPWVAPNAPHTQYHPNGGRSASIPHDHKLKIAFLWLAASDPTRPLPEGYTRPQIKQLFAEQILAGAGRGHNYDNQLLNMQHGREVDDGEGDKPTCGMGVGQWVTQFLAIIANDSPSSRPLSTEIVKNKFKSFLLAEGGHKDAIFGKLTALKKEPLLATQEALKNLIVVNLNDKDALEPAEKALVEHLEFSKATIDAMVNECKTFFSAERITAKTRVDYQGKKYNNYEECLRHMAKNVLQDFYLEIDAKIESLKKPKKATPPKGSDDQAGGKVVRFSGKAAGKAAPKNNSKDNKKDHDEDSDSSPKQARKKR